MNNLSLYISIIALVISIGGWFVVHFFNQKRDNLNRKKDLRIRYLINAWQLLESASNRHDNSMNSNLEKAIADIQLFGTLKQVQLSRNFALEFATTKKANCTALLNNLRDDLRQELKLDKIASSNFVSLRVRDK